MSRWLLDTNVVAELARPRPDPRVLAGVTDAGDSAAIAAVTLHELAIGVERLPPGRRRDGLRAFVSEIAERYPVLPYDRDAAMWHAVVRARLTAQGRPPPFADSQIAATAVSRGLVLVTRSTADFAGFADLAVENWFV